MRPPILLALGVPLLLVTLFPALTPPSDPTHPVGHDREGLPTSTAPQPVWAADPAHPLNRLHAALFVAERVPDEIGATLPAERRRADVDDDAFFRGRWTFHMRKGDAITPSDAAIFGGDVRISPVEDLRGERGATVRTLLADLSTRAHVEAIPALATPLARVLLQWDLLFVLWRHEQNGNADAATLDALARAIDALALPRATLAALPSGVDALRAHVRGDPTDRTKPYMPEQLLAPSLDDGTTVDTTNGWREIARDEKALFHATRSLRAARIFVRAGDGAATEAFVAASAAATDAASTPTAPLGTEVALVLSLVAIDDAGQAFATPVVDELRIRRVTGPAELHPDNGSSRDGWSQWIHMRSRARSVLGAEQPFRFVRDTAQSLFLEYGTAKHTTYFAQCALCHRRTSTGGQDPDGIKALGRYGKPSVERDATARLRIAERQFAPIVEKWRARRDGASAAQGTTDR